MGESLQALATLAGRTVVDAATSHDWERVQREFARYLGRGDDKQTWLAERRLTETRKKLVGAAGSDVALTRTSLRVAWAARLLDFLEENPSTEAELQDLVREIQGEPPVAAAAEPAANGVVSPGSVKGGPADLRALAARSELAYTTGKSGDAAGARDQFAALLPVAERILGPEHPDTLTIRHSCANFAGYAGGA